MTKQVKAGDRFFRLTVQRTEVLHNGVRCHCQCDCGAGITLGASSLGLVRSCGCAMDDYLAKLSTSLTIAMEGKRFGMLTVVERASDPGKTNGVKWRCRCDCGELTEVRGALLRSGQTKSCGCLRSAKRKPAGNLIGKRFGKLTVLARSSKRDNSWAVWSCKCDCGELKNVRGTQLTGGITKSCGCMKRSFGDKIQQNLGTMT